MDKSKNTKTIPESLVASVTTRLFYIATSGKNPNGNLSIQSFTWEVKEFPNYNEIIKESLNRYQNQTNVLLVSISELSHNDFDLLFSHLK